MNTVCIILSLLNEMRKFNDFKCSSSRTIIMSIHYTGKHNVHFDPYESKEHSAVVKLLEEAKFLNLLSSHAGEIRLD